MVTRIDRLARSIDLQDIARALKGKGATLRATEQPIDTSTAAGKCFLDMLACSPSSKLPAARTPARGHSQSQSCWRLKGPARFNRCRQGPPNEGRGHETISHIRQLRIGRASVYRMLAGSDK
jgi:hypothetical protein